MYLVMHSSSEFVLICQPARVQSSMSVKIHMNIHCVNYFRKILICFEISVRRKLPNELNICKSEFWFLQLGEFKLFAFSLCGWIVTLIKIILNTLNPNDCHEACEQEKLLVSHCLD